MPTEAGKKNIQALASIDRVVHEPARLLVLCHLYVVEPG